MELEQNIGNDR